MAIFGLFIVPYLQEIASALSGIAMTTNRKAGERSLRSLTGTRDDDKRKDVMMRLLFLSVTRRYYDDTFRFPSLFVFLH